MTSLLVEKLETKVRDRDETIAQLKQIIRKGKSQSRSFLIVAVGLFFALMANAVLLYKQQQHYQDNNQSCKAVDVKVVSNWSVLDFTRNDLLSRREKELEASRLFQKAASFSGEKGEGRQGWLHLLAAYSYDPTNVHIVSNLFDNYEALQYGSIGYSTLLESGVSTKDVDQICSRDKQRQYASQLQLVADDMDELAKDPGEGASTVMFATSVSRWSVAQLLPEGMNAAIYRQSVEAYEQLKRERPGLSPTDLNHAFFRVQMAQLDSESSSYWGPFKDIPGFAQLVATMRRCVLQFLRDRHGWGEEEARRKASHPLVVWVSVHTEESEHQPHVTEDALVGGVYYVSVPPGSGRLHMFDPRGKHPLRDLVDPSSPPSPPFHRIVSLSPSESLLVLFPGWLVHSVGKASAPSFNSSSSSSSSAKEQRQYRVSLSLNLKGEWGDTASAAFGAPTY